MLEARFAALRRGKPGAPRTSSFARNCRRLDGQVLVHAASSVPLEIERHMCIADFFQSASHFFENTAVKKFRQLRNADLDARQFPMSLSRRWLIGICRQKLQPGGNHLMVT